jgi:hypothetical protein
MVPQECDCIRNQPCDTHSTCRERLSALSGRVPEVGHPRYANVLAILNPIASFQRPPVGMHSLQLAPVLEAPEITVPSNIIWVPP